MAFGTAWVRDRWTAALFALLLLTSLFAATYLALGSALHATQHERYDSAQHAFTLLGALLVLLTAVGALASLLLARHTRAGDSALLTLGGVLAVIFTSMSLGVFALLHHCCDALSSLAKATFSFGVLSLLALLGSLALWTVVLHTRNVVAIVV